MFKKILISAGIISVILQLPGCKTQDDADVYVPYISEIKESHSTELYENESPYTLCFENEDGTTSFYIFNSPIAFYDKNKKLNIIDNSIIETDKEIKKNGYAYKNKNSDITSYYPSRLESTPLLIEDSSRSLLFKPEGSISLGECRPATFIDRGGKIRDAVCYTTDDDKTSVQFIPVNSGIYANITFNEKPDDCTFTFYLKYNRDVCYDKNNNQYTVFNDNSNNTQFIIYNSFLADSGGNTSFSNTVSISENDGWIKYTVLLDEDYLSNSAIYPVSFNPEINLFRETIDDTAVYSNMPDVNDNLNVYSVIGNNEFFGTGSDLIRLKINYFMRSYAENIKSASYNTVSLYAVPGLLQTSVNRIDSFWDYQSATWNNMPEVGKEEYVSDISDETCVSFDITYQIMRCINDDTWNTELNGIAIQGKSASDVYKILASSNNSLYNTYVRIDLYDKPWSYENLEIIN